MAVSIKNMFIGILLFSAVMMGLFTFTNEWISAQNMAMDPQLRIIEGGVNESLETMYSRSKADADVVSKSSVYTGESSKDVLSLEPYKILTGSYDMAKDVIMNTTTEAMKLNLLPSWIFDLAIAAFLITLTFLAMAAIFKVNQV